MPLLEEVDDSSEAWTSPAEKFKTEHRRKRAKGRKKKSVKVGRSILTKTATIRSATCSLQYNFALKGSRCSKRTRVLGHFLLSLEVIVSGKAP